MNIEQYMLFGGQDYYPSGGAEDLIGIFPDIQSCKDYLSIYNNLESTKKDYKQAEWAHIYHEGKIILWFYGMNDSSDWHEETYADWRYSANK